jgi:hypothetical protein
MKTKKNEKKLTLNKTTIAVLNGAHMSAARGGGLCPTQTISPSCETCFAVCVIENRGGDSST